MAKRNQRIAEIIAQRLFKQTLKQLDFDRLIEVYDHQRKYKTYRRSLVEYLREPMNFKKPNGDVYDCIFEWYIAGIPLELIQKMIDACWAYTRKKDQTINSIYYIDKAVKRSWRGHLERQKEKHQVKL